MLPRLIAIPEIQIYSGGWVGDGDRPPGRKTKMDILMPPYPALTATQKILDRGFASDSTKHAEILLPPDVR